MNVYLVLLRRFTSLRDASLGQGDGVDGPWMALGHMDAMYTKALDLSRDGVFQAIQKSNRAITAHQDKAGYLHPLYLVTQQNDGEFWKLDKDRPYLAVVRVHFSASVADKSFRQVQTELESSVLCSEQCIWRFYQTIELSDMILAIRSSRLSWVVQAALSLRKCPGVGKVYTYFGIDASLVKAASPAVEEEDKIPLAAIRFSARDFALAKELTAEMKELVGREAAYSITGVDDIMFSWEDLPVRELLRIYHWWYGYPDREKLDRAFFSVTTRMGISMEDLSFDQECWPARWPPRSAEILRETCGELEALSWEILKDAKANGFLTGSENDPAAAARANRFDWVELLPKLCRILVHMSDTPVLDEFVYLMLPGVRAFLKNVKRELTGLYEEDLEACASFVENWINLMEQVMRIEGQLTHHPETRPVLYDIPIAMLEYTLAFLWKVTHALREGEDKDGGETAFLLVPRLCSRIQAQELFPAGKENPGLILVTIPFKALYDPQEVQWVLTHEASHFVGEKSRYRMERLDFFLRSAAPLIAREALGTDHPAAVTAVQNALTSSPVLTEDRPDRMRFVEPWLNRWLNGLEENTAEFWRIMQEALRESQRIGKRLELSPELMNPAAARSWSLSIELSDLCILYREIYADLCMLCLLGMNAEQYVNSFLPELASHQKSYEQMAIRIYVCASVALKTERWDFVAGKDALLCGKLKKIADKDPKGRTFPDASVQPILEYAQLCYESLEKRRERSKECDEVERMYRVASQTGDSYDELLRSVEAFRAGLLGLSHPGDFNS